MVYWRDKFLSERGLLAAAPGPLLLGQAGTRRGSERKRGFSESWHRIQFHAAKRLNYLSRVGTRAVARSAVHDRRRYKSVRQLSDPPLVENQRKLQQWAR